LLNSDAHISGGSIGHDLRVQEYGGVTPEVLWNGGTIAGDLFARAGATIEIGGYDFEVDGVPVSLGDLASLTGVLTGTLGNGDSIDNVFFHNGYDENTMGTIVLVPEPATAFLSSAGILSLGVARRRFSRSNHSG
jgi:hypothetical protein